MREKRYILNNYYLLKHDQKRALILSPGDAAYRKPIKVDSSWMSRIHPVYAMMISFFSEPTTLLEGARKISAFLSVNPDRIQTFLRELVSMEEPMYCTLDASNSGFPTNILIEETEEFTPRVHYHPNEFSFTELDFKTDRMFVSPISLVFMPNNNCATDCVYCYADTKTRTDPLSMATISKFVREAKSLRMRDVLITGGDFFMYPHWEGLLDLLVKEDYCPDLISTKVPLTQAEIERFSRFRIRLQISLDAISEEILMQDLRVPAAYASRIKRTLELLDESPIQYQIATVLTSLNSSINELEQLASFIKRLQNVERWEIRVAFKSLYSKESFDSIKASRKIILQVRDWITMTRDEMNVRILWSPDDDAKYRKISKGSRYFEGAKCSANMTNMVVLPDGKVTVCEQLYWHPQFIIGDINENTIEEIWNSEAAISLWHTKQSTINQASPCGSCPVFEDCFRASNRCYANIMKAYGKTNWDFPDPRCQLAPTFQYDITHA